MNELQSAVVVLDSIRNRGIEDPSVDVLMRYLSERYGRTFSLVPLHSNRQLNHYDCGPFAIFNAKAAIGCGIQGWSGLALAINRVEVDAHSRVDIIDQIRAHALWQVETLKMKLQPLKDAEGKVDLGSRTFEDEEFLNNQLVGEIKKWGYLNNEGILLSFWGRSASAESDVIEIDP